MLPSNASSLEITWSLIALVGLMFALWLFELIWKSYRAVLSWIEQGLAVRWGPRHKFVLGFLTGVGLLVLIWVGFIALGINAMLTPEPLSVDRQEAAERGGWILVGLEALLLIFSVVLLYAWIAVGGPSLRPNPAPHGPPP